MAAAGFRSALFLLGLAGVARTSTTPPSPGGFPHAHRAPRRVQPPPEPDRLRLLAIALLLEADSPY